MKLIDGDELINKLTETQVAAYAEGDVFHNGVSEGLHHAIKVIAKMKTIDPVKRGEWLLKHIGHGHYFECSVCHKNPCIYVTEDTKFCPNCGAEMK